MINIRFHLVSLVAVFLALGVGVAMGASFIDRATVENMQGRVDDLEVGFRERGSELDVRSAQQQQSDEVADALTQDTSRAVAGVLDEEPVVVVVPSDLPDGSAEVLTSAVVASGADITATLRLQPRLLAGAPEDPTDDDIEALGRALGDLEPRDDDPVVSARLALAESLAALSAAPAGAGAATGGIGEPGADQESTDQESTTPPDGDGGSPDDDTDAGADGGADDGVGATVIGVEEASALLERFTQEGLVSIDTGGLPVEEGFPSVTGVRYLTLVSPSFQPAFADWVVPFAQSYGDLAPATMVVAAFDGVRDPGQMPPEEPSVEATLEPLRSGPVSTEVTTVAQATEPLARLSVVYSLAALGEGIVGHYGIGDGVSSPFPPAAEE